MSMAQFRYWCATGPIARFSENRPIQTPEPGNERRDSGFSQYVGSLDPLGSME